MKLIGSLFAAAAVLIAMPARADVAWSANATSCMPDPASIDADRYTTTGTRVAPSANNINPIRLTCEITSHPDPGRLNWNLAVTYRDSTGTSASAHVLAALVRVARAGGSQVTVATFNSDGSSAAGINKGLAPFQHTFNFDANYYYVEVFLDRTLTTEIVEAFGVALEE